MMSDLFKKQQVLLCLSLMAIAALLLWWQGRLWWCPAGDAWPWSWTINSQHNSQHILDAYTFTHVLHGILEFWLIGIVFRRVPLAWRLVIAVGIEASWEVIENTSYVIERYRAATISLDYFGDSIANSLSDITCCAVGFAIGYKLKFWRSAALFAATEAILMLTVRDSLIINLIMLIHPIDAVKAWQAGQ
jgi:hypothetical protein